MTKNSLLSFVCCCALFFLSCAYRDNNYDPQSPLYRVIPPSLSVVFTFDSTKISSENNDTIYAFTPLNLTISASSKGGSGHQTDLEILYQHIVNGIQQDMDLIEDQIQITLQDSGTHLLKFQSTEKTGTSVATQQKVFVLHHRSAPVIYKFLSNTDTMFTGQNYQIQLTAEVTDSNSLLDKLIYQTPSSGDVIKSFENHPLTVHDTLLFPISSLDTGKQIITLKAVDILGREDSMNVNLYFKNRIVWNPPVIDSIIFNPQNITVWKDVDFKVYYSSSSENVTQYFSYGEHGTLNWTTESTHTYFIPGRYKVAVMVVDDSGFSDTDSIYVQVNPIIKNNSPQISNLTISPDSGNAPLTVLFNISANDSDDDNLYFLWRLGTGYEFPGTSEFAFTYWYAKKYPVTVMVWDNKGGSDTIFDTITVTGGNGNNPCLAAYPSPAFTNQYIFFKLENAPQNFNDANFIWEFPMSPPDKSSEPYAKHQFTLNGDFEVKLSVILKDTAYYYSVPVKIVMPKF